MKKLIEVKRRTRFLGILTFIIIFVSTFSFQNNLHSQWNIISYVNTTQLNCVKFFDVNIGITCGTSGIWRSTNSGYNWNQVLNSTSSINSLSFPDRTNGMAVGDSGKIFKSIDSGKTWQSISSPTINNLYTICMGSIASGYAAGQSGIIIRSGNAGWNWGINFQSNPNINFYKILELPSLSEGYVMGGDIYGNGPQYYTINSGYNWLGTGYTSTRLNSIYCFNFQSIICVGSGGKIARSTSGGWNWSYPLSQTTYDLYDVAFTDNNNGWVCGDISTILHSSNGGLNWTQQTLSTAYNLRSLSMISSSLGWCVGGNGAVYGFGVPNGIKNNQTKISKSFELYQNYPNPFNPSTKIKFNIAETRGQMSEVRLIVYNILGREVTTLVNEKLSPGNYEIEWNAIDLSSGIYFYKLSTVNFSETKKLILIK